MPTVKVTSCYTVDAMQTGETTLTLNDPLQNTYIYIKQRHNNLVKQTPTNKTIAPSLAEAECMAVTQVTKEAVWLQ
jgi:hypothetical protein